MVNGEQTWRLYFENMGLANLALVLQNMKGWEFQVVCWDGMGG